MEKEGGGGAGFRLSSRESMRRGSVGHCAWPYQRLLMYDQQDMGGPNMLMVAGLC